VIPRIDTPLVAVDYSANLLGNGFLYGCCMEP